MTGKVKAEQVAQITDPRYTQDTLPHPDDDNELRQILGIATFNNIAHVFLGEIRAG